MKSVGRLRLWSRLCAVLLVWVMVACTRKERIAVEQRMPHLNLVQLSGTAGDLASLSKGRVALVVFWATWCSRCREEVPNINQLVAHYGLQSLAVIGVSTGEPLHVVKAHVARLGIRYPVFVATELSPLTKLGIDRIPLLVLLDAKGQIQQIENEVNESLQEEIKQLIAQNALLAK